MKDKTILLLVMCSMKYTFEEVCPRSALYEALCEEYHGKAILRKLEELCDRGYIECGTSLRSSWLTDKGKQRLKEEVERMGVKHGSKTEQQN